MKKTVAEIRDLLTPESLGAQIAEMYSNLHQNRLTWLAQKKELRNYIFATDTTTTTNSKLPWKNKTTLPKLCQIRDNLAANYMSALFPNDDWMKWEAYTEEAAMEDKRKAITAYMSNKIREGGFVLEVEKLINDYIDYGNVFYDVEWVNETHEDTITGEKIQGFMGPKLARVSPEDHVFNITASDYDHTYKITRYVKTMGELMEEVESKPELAYNAAIVARSNEVRKALSQFSPEDINKASAIQIDGFGSLSDYYQSDMVELLEFEGSIHDKHTGELKKNHVITVVDRCWVVRCVPMPSWFGKSMKGHCGWRERPDNLYAMGPLDNLVGIQYRIDHLENSKSDAVDLAIHPPLAIAGSVEEGEWGPGQEWYLNEGGSVAEIAKNLNGVISAEQNIPWLQQQMEEMAGAPKQAMGIRTPGEKTAFEVQTLEMAASRIFQNKIRKFELLVLEPALNKMLELARRNMDAADVIRVMDDDFGAAEFMKITKDDITASGKLRPIGARHFAAQAALVQNLNQLLNGTVGQDEAVTVHLSGKKIAKLFEELLGLEKYEIYEENARIYEAVETQRLMQAGSSALMEEGMIDPSEPPVPPEEAV